MTRYTDPKGRTDFDFQTMIAKARADYPDALKDATFINSSSRISSSLIAAHYKKHLAPTLTQPQTEQDVQSFVDTILENNGIVVPSSKMLAMYTKKYDAEFLPKGREQDELKFTFVHELAHLLMPQRTVEDVLNILEQDTDDFVAASAFIGNRFTHKFEDLRKNIQEAQADCFAAITGLRDGWLSVEDVLTIADTRKADLKDDPDARHMTHDALIALVDDYHDGKYAGWSAEQVRDTAYMHGKLFAPTGAEVKQAQREYLKSSRQEQPGRKIDIIDIPDKKPKADNHRKPRM